MRLALGAAASAALLIVSPWAPLAAAANTPASLPPVLELPPWAIGFFWTYNYNGPTYQAISGFTATWVNDTYTSEIVGQASTPRGEAWVVRNAHSGNMSGEVLAGPGSLPAEATFSQLAFYFVRKSDLAVLNFTQDLNVSANLSPLVQLRGNGHNETVADPPLAQIAFGAPADGTPWRVASNLTSTGWFQIEPGPPQNTSSYVNVDYTLAVRRTETVTVPAGTFETYNISGNGTVDGNGTVYNYTELFLWSPEAQERVVDAAGYKLVSLFVNRAPAARSAIPPVRIEAGSYNDSLSLGNLVADPEGSPVTFTGCDPALPLRCTVSSSGALNVSSPPGVNATLTVSVNATDGLPGGSAAIIVTVLVRGPGNTNSPPTWVGPSSYSLDEDTSLTVAIADTFDDPDDATLSFAVEPGAPLSVVSLNATSFTVRAPKDWNGASSLNLTVFDLTGNDLTVSPGVIVAPRNDPPEIFPLDPPDLFVHADSNLTVRVGAADVDGDALFITWALDGKDVLTGPSTFTYVSDPSDRGNHTLVATVRDPDQASSSTTFTIHLFGGPHIAEATPANRNLHIASGSVITFALNATDSDSLVLSYRWTDGAATVLAEGSDATSLRVTFETEGTFVVLATVADNGSSASVQWNITVEVAPPGLVIIESPLDNTTYSANTSLVLSAIIDSRLTNVSIEWRLNGSVVATTGRATLPPPPPGNHTLELAVTGLYNSTVPYSTVLSLTVRVLPPASPGPSNPTTIPPSPNPPPADTSWMLPLIGIAALAAAAAAGFLIVRRRRRETP